jgi:ribonuclease H / adenosylcobalamin/alpha-ribazole phosphatase
MSAILLVRHASTSWSGRRYCGRSDPPLSDAGRREAAILAATLIGELPRDTRIVTSPSRRARQTADAIASAAQLATPEIDARWMEADVGAAEGRTFDELSAEYPDLASAILAGATAVDWPGGETAIVFSTRVATAWQAATTTLRPTVVVSHAGPIRLALTLAGYPPDDSAVLAPAMAIRVPMGLALRTP